jgi:hypothetical protein
MMILNDSFRFPSGLRHIPTGQPILNKPCHAEQIPNTGYIFIAIYRVDKAFRFDFEASATLRLI